MNEALPQEKHWTAPPSDGSQSAYGHELGAAYRERLELEDGLLLTRKANLLVIFRKADAFHFDLAGRLHRAWIDGHSYQRGLDGRLRRVSFGDSSGPHRYLEIELLDQGRGEGILGASLHAAMAAASRLPESAPDSLRLPLFAARAWSSERYAEEAERFARVYEFIPILPPSENRALVLQITSGCSWNRCTFCHLYHGVAFRVRSLDELRQHIIEVKELLGPAIELRRGLFLGQANAFCIPHPRLLGAIQIIRESFPDQKRWPMSTFVDSFTRRRSFQELVELRAYGLRSLALGLESGSQEVLAHLGKPQEVKQAVALVQEARAAGLSVEVIVLVGAGGHKLGSTHLRDTVGAISEMSLGKADRVFLSPLCVSPESRYALEAKTHALGIMNRGELLKQSSELRDLLRARGIPSPIARYDIRRFIY